MYYKRFILLLLFFSVFPGCSSEADIGKPFDFGAVSKAYRTHSQKIAANSSSPIGINVNGPVDWTTSYPFVDIFRTARPFFTEDGGEATFDKHGWLKTFNNKGSVSSPMFWDIPVPMMPEGDYVVTYDGKGRLQYECAEVRHQSRTRNRAVIHIGGGDCGLYLKIKQSDNKNPVRNIKITMPGGICEGKPFQKVIGPENCRGSRYLSFEEHADDIVFNPDFLSFLQNFSVLRFMDAGETNNSKVETWSQRPVLADATWQDRGFPVEVIVKLGNILHRDIWVTLPHQANDDFIRRYANYVKKNLDPELKVFIEYSNEVWNGMFTQNQYARDQGNALKLDENYYHAGWRYYSQRSVEIFRIWERVFGGTSRLVRVMASQTDDPWMSNLLLSHKDAYKHTDALAVAAYFGVNVEREDAPDLGSISLDGLFQYVTDKELPDLLVLLKRNREVAEKYDLPLVAYEGGQHFVGVGDDVDNPRIQSLFTRANHDLRIKDLYKRLYAGWKHVGGTLFVHYASPSLYSKWGSWGIKEYLSEPRSEAPKYDATLEFIEKNPRWW
ncbi:MAG TPA: hypothetical protein ENJ35_02170 [Gammaproteobacteria bacterium]|nr:hypothetical protein [Gammaproteobacteria bacterium]